MLIMGQSIPSAERHLQSKYTETSQLSFPLLWVDELRVYDFVLH